MNVNFNRKQIASIIANVRMYKTLYVTTQGVMFRSVTDAENAVRTINSILDDPADYVGIATLNAASLTDDAIKAIGKDDSKFAELFKDAYVPRSKKRVSAREDVPSAGKDADVSDIESLLNDSADAEAEAKPAEAEVKPAEEKPNTPATSVTTKK